MRANIHYVLVDVGPDSCQDEQLLRGARACVIDSDGPPRIQHGKRWWAEGSPPEPSPLSDLSGQFSRVFVGISFVLVTVAEGMR